MLLPLLLTPLTLSALPQAQTQDAQATRLEVHATGVFEVHPQTGQQSGGSVQTLVAAPRWQEDDLGLAWIANHVAIGDHGAAMVAGKELNNESVAVYGTGSGTPIFDSSVLGANNVRVAMASGSPYSAALETTDIGGGVYQSTLHAFDNTGTGTALFSATLPSTGNVIAGAVAVSADGSQFTAIVSNASGQQHLRAYDATGAVTASHDLPLAANIRHGLIDDTGKRVYLGLYNGTCEIYEVATGTLLHSQALGGTFDSHAFSADGTTFAYGNFSGLFVVQETAPGVWSQVASRFGNGGEYLGRCALSADGSTAAFAAQRYSPAYDHLEYGMFDVNSGTDLFSVSVDAPGTINQLVTSGCSVAADGSNAAFGSWGDSLGATATIQAYDRAGTQTAAVTTPGSVFSIALDSAGDVIAAGSKAVHANDFGNGGSTWCVDAYDHTLHMLGTAQVAGTLSLESPAGATSLTLGVSSGLATSVTPFGIAEIDLGALMATVGPLPVGAGGLVQAMGIPNNPALAGTEVHFQAIRVVGGVSGLTNKVSVRMLP